jgi:hypothetical protein
MRHILFIAAAFACTSGAQAEFYRDRYWPKPETNEEAATRLLNAYSYSPDPDVMAKQIDAAARLEEARIRAAVDAYKVDQETLRKGMTGSDVNVRVQNAPTSRRR